MTFEEVKKLDDTYIMHTFQAQAPSASLKVRALP